MYLFVFDGSSGQRRVSNRLFLAACGRLRCLVIYLSLFLLLTRNTHPSTAFPLTQALRFYLSLVCFLKPVHNLRLPIRIPFGWGWRRRRPSVSSWYNLSGFPCGRPPFRSGLPLISFLASPVLSGGTEVFIRPDGPLGLGGGM